MKALVLKACALALVSASLTFAAPPSADEIKATYESGDYKKTLQQITLALTSSDAAGYDRYDLLMRRGDCLLRTNVRSSAIDAFEDAATATTDLKKRAWARAMVVLTKSGAKGDVDRKEALQALFDSMNPKIEAKVDKAENFTAVPPLQKLAEEIIDLGCVEAAATGSAPIARGYLERIGERALDLVTRELNKIEYRLREIRSIANDVVISGDNVSRRGYYTNDRNEMSKMVKYAKEIEKLCRQIRQTARDIGFTGERWNQAYGDAADLVDQLEAMAG